MCWSSRRGVGMCHPYSVLVVCGVNSCKSNPVFRFFSCQQLNWSETKACNSLACLCVVLAYSCRLGGTPHYEPPVCSRGLAQCFVNALSRFTLRICCITNYASVLKMLPGLSRPDCALCKSLTPPVQITSLCSLFFCLRKRCTSLLFMQTTSSTTIRQHLFSYVHLLDAL